MSKFQPISTTIENKAEKLSASNQAQIIFYKFEIITNA